MNRIQFETAEEFYKWVAARPNYNPCYTLVVHYSLYDRSKVYMLEQRDDSRGSHTIYLSEKLGGQIENIWSTRTTTYGYTELVGYKTLTAILKKLGFRNIDADRREAAAEMELKNRAIRCESARRYAKEAAVELLKQIEFAKNNGLDLSTMTVEELASMVIEK